MALGKRAWRWRKRAWRGAIVKVARGNTKPIKISHLGVFCLVLLCRQKEQLERSHSDWNKLNALGTSSHRLFAIICFRNVLRCFLLFDQGNRMLVSLGISYQVRIRRVKQDIMKKGVLDETIL